MDGFRCDMAHLVPRQAWQYLIGNARQPERDPECYFLAEAYVPSGMASPVLDLNELTAAGFNAVYHSHSYDALKRVYQGAGSTDDYDRVVTGLATDERPTRLAYLENHDERRIASAIEPGRGPGDSGFGSMAAGYQLAPLQFLFGGGPVLLYNGQEVGEPGAGAEGFSSGDGRTTTFDYWCMPQFARWVNGHAYDGGGLSADQQALRQFYAHLLALCQDPAIRGAGYWGLRYFNRSARFADCPDDLYTFARFEDGGGRLFLVAGSFRPNATVEGRVRLPAELADLVRLPERVTVRLVLGRGGARHDLVAEVPRAALTTDGFAVSVPNQTTHVYLVG